MEIEIEIKMEIEKKKKSFSLIKKCKPHKSRNNLDFSRELRTSSSVDSLWDLVCSKQQENQKKKKSKKSKTNIFFFPSRAAYFITSQKFQQTYQGFNTSISEIADIKSPYQIEAVRKKKKNKKIEKKK